SAVRWLPALVGAGPGAVRVLGLRRPDGRRAGPDAPHPRGAGAARLRAVGAVPALVGGGHGVHRADPGVGAARLRRPGRRADAARLLPVGHRAPALPGQPHPGGAERHRGGARPGLAVHRHRRRRAARHGRAAVLLPLPGGAAAARPARRRPLPADPAPPGVRADHGCAGVRVGAPQGALGVHQHLGLHALPAGAVADRRLGAARRRVAAVGGAARAGRRGRADRLLAQPRAVGGAGAVRGLPPGPAGAGRTVRDRRRRRAGRAGAGRGAAGVAADGRGPGAGRQPAQRPGPGRHQRRRRAGRLGVAGHRLGHHPRHAGQLRIDRDRPLPGVPRLRQPHHRQQRAVLAHPDRQRVGRHRAVPRLLRAGGRAVPARRRPPRLGRPSIGPTALLVHVLLCRADGAAGGHHGRRRPALAAGPRHLRGSGGCRAVNGETTYLTDLAEILWPCGGLLGRGADAAPGGDPGRPGPDGEEPEESGSAVRAYLPVPSAHNPRVIVPATDRYAAARGIAAFAQRHSFREKVRTALLTTAFASGIAPLLLRDRLHVGSGRTIEHALAAALDREVVVAIHVGPPRANRKPVLLLLTPAGRAVGYAKVGVNDLTSRLVRDEIRALRRLADARLPDITVPRLLHQGEWNGRPLLVQEALPVGAQTERPTRRQLLRCV